MSHSTRRRAGGKAPSGQQPTKPKKNGKKFVLGVHKGTGYWCKKISGHVYYFGRVCDDPKGEAALEQYLAEKDDFEAGREPRDKTDELTVADLANKFIDHHKARRDNAQISPRTFRGYYDTTEGVVKAFGRNRLVTDLVPDDFRKLRAKLANRLGLVALRNEIQRVRSLFKFGFDAGAIVTPVRFGRGFDRPTTEAVDRERELHRAERGDRMFEAEEIRQILNGKTLTDDDGNERFIPRAKQPLRAMVLLAANCGFGPTDLASLPTRAVDLDSGWVTFP